MSLLLRVLLDPAQARALPESGWDLLVRQARAARLLAELDRRLAATPQLTIPEAPRLHLEAARRLVQRQAQMTRWELRCIARALDGEGLRPVLLKGAAYQALGLPLARGRMFGDVDLLVPREQLERTESALLRQGWEPEPMSAYDQRYYRRWMHEIPPLRHRHRASVLDLHHALLPPTSRIAVRNALLFDALQPLPEWPGLSALAPADLLLHSATHLFQEGELESGLRDLLDLDALLRHFGATPDFWAALLPRARALGLGLPLYYALWLCHELLQTPVPPQLLAASRADGPPRWRAPLMRALYRRALRPHHPSCDGATERLARFALYVRSHWLRMPLPLLSAHLARKAWMRLSPPALPEQA